jgi:hypothetical protein
MNTKQRLTELLRTKITNRLNEMNGDGPYMGTARGDNSSGWNPNGEIIISSVISGGENHLIHGGAYHPGIIDRTRSDGHFAAFGTQVDVISDESEELHKNGMIKGVKVGYKTGHVEHITDPNELANFFDGGKDSVFAGHLRGDLGELDHLHVSVKED